MKVDVGYSRQSLYVLDNVYLHSTKYGLLSEEEREVVDIIRTFPKYRSSLEAFPFSFSSFIPLSSSTFWSMRHFLTNPEMTDTHSSESASACKALAVSWGGENILLH